MTSAIRFGVLGAAAIATDTVIPAMQKVDGVICHGIASQRPGAAAVVAEKLGIPKAYDSYDALLLDQEIDAVYIPVANGQHMTWAIKAAEHGKHIPVEKPIACTAAEAEAMFAAAAAHGVRIMEAFAYWFHPQHAEVMRMIEEGPIGAPVQVRGRLSYPLLEIQKKRDRLDVRLDPNAGGAGVLLDHGCYCIHTACRIFGTAPVSVTAHSIYNENGVDIATAGIVEFPGGRTLIFDTHFNVDFALDYEVTGVRGTIRVPKGYGRWGPGNEFPVELQAVGVGRKTTMVPYVEHAEPMLAHFAELIRNPELTPFISHEESMTVMRTIDACFESARSGRRVSLAE